MRLLIVDDDIISRITLGDILRDILPITVCEVDGAQSAWEFLSGPNYPLMVFCDLNMPGINGAELVQKIRADPLIQDICVVLATATADLNSMRRLRELNIASALVKPFEVDAVSTRLQKLFTNLCTKGIEAPEDAILRMRINEERYQEYIEMLRKQIVAIQIFAKNCLIESTPNTNKNQLIKKAESLHSGCVSLGLYIVAKGVNKILADIKAHGVHEATITAMTDLTELLNHMTQFYAGHNS
jgi:CheY-like chemotaxis protein